MKNIHEPNANLLRALQRNRRRFLWQLATLRFALTVAILALLTYALLTDSAWLATTNVILILAIARLIWEIRTWRA